FHRHVVQTVDEHGSAEVILEVPEQPSGLGWLPDGSLLVVSMKDHRLIRRWPDGRATHTPMSRASVAVSSMTWSSTGPAAPTSGTSVSRWIASRDRQRPCWSESTSTARHRSSPTICSSQTARSSAQRLELSSDRKSVVEGK